MIDCHSVPGKTVFSIILPIENNLIPYQGEKMSQVWVLDDDKSIRWVFEKALAKANITFECFSVIPMKLSTNLTMKNLKRLSVT